MRTRPSTYRSSVMGLVRLATFALCLFAHARVRADDRELIAPYAAEPERTSAFGVELHLAAVLPFVDVLCPDAEGNACLLNEGVGVGASIERRWLFGGALLLGYDMSFLSGSGVYEVGVLQTLRAGAKWVVPLSTALKPYFELAAGAVLFGDSFTIATAGGSFQFGVGGELEFAENYALVVGLTFRGFSTGSFISPNDMVARGSDPGANLALMMQIGVLYLED